MPELLHQTPLPHPRDQVFRWHERPGAVVRLTPPTDAHVLQEPTDGLRDGSETVLAMHLPATFGRASLRWRARHQGYAPPARFEDVMVSGPLSAWHHVHELRESDGHTVVTDHVTYELPVPGPARATADRVVRPRLERMFAYRGRQMADDMAFHARHPDPQVVAVTGASGMLGRQLVALLGGGGHDVRRLTRGAAEAPDQIRWDPEQWRLDPDALRDVDVVIHLAAEPIGRRFTAAHKQAVMRSRSAGTDLVARTLAALAADGRPRALVAASAAGYYGADRGDKVVDEDSESGDDFLADVCRVWESACDPAREAGVRVVNVRTGIVQSPAGGQLGLQLPLFMAGVGGPLGSGRQWTPWITIDDIVGLFAHVALTPGLHGPVNGSAPGIVRNAEYARTLGSVLHRPAVVPAPSAGPAVLLGREGAHELALAGQRMVSRAEQWGYAFRHPELREALRHVLAR